MTSPAVPECVGEDYSGHTVKGYHPQTRVMEAGYNASWSEGSVVPPVFRTSTFRFPSAEEGKKSFEVAYGLRAKGPHEHPALIYSRVNNPNMEIIEDKLRALTGGEDCVVTSSGMAAVSNTVMAVCRPGDSIVFTDPVYGGTFLLFTHILTQWGIKAHAIKTGATTAEMVEALRSVTNVKALYIETPANPTITLTSVREAREAITMSGLDVALIVDDTFCGPTFTRALHNGADIAVYSATKFIGGHSDLIAGAVIGKSKYLKSVKVNRTTFGSVPDPDTCWLINRSLPTLTLRMKSAQENALSVVAMLQSHKGVMTVLYPGVPNTNLSAEEQARQQVIFQNEYSGSGSIVSFEVRGGEKEAFIVLNAVKIWKLAVSLGGVESLVQHPSSMTHSDLTEEEKRVTGITEGMIRLSVGIEDVRDLVNDLRQALDKAFP